MADSILRLKVESQEYDQKIRRAAEGIQRYAQKCREVGVTLEHLDEGVLDFVQALGRMDTVATGTKQQLREMSNALTTLTQTYRGLTDEEKASPFGQELAKGIQQLTERAGQAKDAMMDVEISIRNAASDTRLFDQMAQGMSVATAGFQGLTGAGKLLGIEMGNDVEVIAKLQAAMAVTNSLTTIQTALQKESALMQGIMAIKTNAAATAQALLARNTVIATAAGKAFNLVAKASPLGLIVTAAAAATAAIVLFGEKSEKVSQQEKDRREVAIRQMQREQAERKRLADRAKEESDTIRTSTGDVVAKYKILQAEWNTLKTAQEKNTFLKDNASAFDALGASIKTAADAQKFFVEQSDKVIKALSAMARAEAMKDLLKEQYKKNASFDPNNVDKSQYKVSTAEMRQLSPSNRSTTYLANGKTPTAYSKSQQDSYIQNFIRQNKELSAAGLTASDYKYNYAKGGTGQMEYHMNVSGLSKLEEYRKNNYLTKLQDEADTHTKFLEGQLEEAATEAAKAQSGISAFKGSGTTPQQNTKEVYKAGEVGALEQELSKLQTAQKHAANADEWEEYNEKIREVRIQIKELKGELVSGFADPIKKWSQGEGKVSVTDDMRRAAWKDVDKREEAFENKDISSMISKTFSKIKTPDLASQGEATAKSWEKAANAIGNVGTALQAIEDPGVKVVGIIANAIATIAQTFAASLKGTFTPWDWIAGAAAGTATMISTINAIKAATKTENHAAGGFIGGNSYSGDNILMPINGGYAGLSSGELVLNRAQQGALASQLQDMSSGTDLPPYLTGEMIYLGLQAYTRRSGMGEIVTSNR